MRGLFTWAQVRDRELHYRPDIDGLRGIAILAVVGFHAFPTLLPGGYVGVDVFFVISGFLISTLILKQQRHARFTLAEFYVRRARRLFPALAIVLLACLVFGWFALLPGEFEDLGKHVAAAAAFVLNFAVWREGGYFDPAANLNPVLHLWSLGIEEQFYLAWPLVLLGLARHRRGLVITLAALIATSFALNIVFMHTDPKGGFYLPVTRFWELGLGCLLAVFQDIREAAAKRSGVSARLGADKGPSRLAVLRPAVSVLGFALICGAALLFDNRMAFPSWAALIPVAGAMCIICAPEDTAFQRHIMASGPLVFVGAISYPLYLWHWPVLSFATILGSGAVPLEVRVGAVVLSFALAFVVFRFVEQPLRSRPAVRASGALAAGLGTLGIAGLLIFTAAGISARFGHDVRALQTTSRVNRYCLRTFGGHEDFNYCKRTSAAAPEVLFLGDSRAQAVYDGMVSLAGRRYSMMLLARGGCPPMLNAQTDPSDRHEVSCDKTWADFVRYVHELNPAVVVLVGGGAGKVREPGGLETFEFKERLGELIAALQNTTRVIYVRETPGFDTGPACFLRPVRLPWGACSPVMTRAAIEQRLAAYNQAVDDIEGQFPGLVVVESIDALCGSKYCAQKLRSGEILYRDPLHLTAAGARRLDKSSGLFAAIDRQVQSRRASRYPG